jgi:PII-like signaling protein
MREGKNMSDQAKLLRIYTDEAAYYGDRKVFEVVATRARDAKMAGVTVLQALFGFGRSVHVHRRHVLEDDQSLVVEIVDQDAQLRAFVASLSDVTGIGLITLEAVEIIGGEAAPVIEQGGESR